MYSKFETDFESLDHRLGRMLRVNNEAHFDQCVSTRIAYAINDTDEQLIGGITATISRNWMYINKLIVTPTRRRGGLGKLLLHAAEERAIDLDCVGCYVMTYSFQVPDFYSANGFEKFGVLEDFPLGHQRIFMRKRLLR